MITLFILQSAMALPPPGGGLPPRGPAYTRDGAGTPLNPWQIDTAAKLESIGDSGCNNSNTAGCDDTFAITADIDMSGRTLNPIGTASNPFTGTVWGNFHEISNVHINAPNDDNIGLFGKTEGAYLTAILLDNADVTGDDNAGALLGYGAAGTTLDACEVTNSTVDGDIGVGGIAGGFHDGGIFDSAVAASDVIGSNTVGGAVGYLVNGTMARTSVDHNSTVSGGYAAGGLVARATYSGVGGGSTISNAYSRADVSGINPGGFASVVQSSSVTDSYAAGPVTGSGKDGFVVTSQFGYSYQDCFWDMYVSGDYGAGPAGTTGSIPGVLQDPSTYSGIWDLTYTWLVVSGSYPTLR